jgi:hypothetical protein
VSINTIKTRAYNQEVKPSSNPGNIKAIVEVSGHTVVMATLHLDERVGMGISYTAANGIHLSLSRYPEVYADEGIIYLGGRHPDHGNDFVIASFGTKDDAAMFGQMIIEALQDFSLYWIGFRDREKTIKKKQPRVLNVNPPRTAYFGENPVKDISLRPDELIEETIPQLGRSIPFDLDEPIPF